MFGGVADKSWASSGGAVASDASFLFCITCFSASGAAQPSSAEPAAASRPYGLLRPASCVLSEHTCPRDASRGTGRRADAPLARGATDMPQNGPLSAPHQLKLAGSNDQHALYHQDTGQCNSIEQYYFGMFLFIQFSF